MLTLPWLRSDSDQGTNHLVLSKGQEASLSMDPDSRVQEISPLVDQGSREQEISPSLDPGFRAQEIRTLVDPGLRQMMSYTAGCAIQGACPERSLKRMVWEIQQALNSPPMIGTG